MRVLVHVSTTRVPFWYRFFEPQPYGVGFFQFPSGLIPHENQGEAPPR